MPSRVEIDQGAFDEMARDASVAALERASDELVPAMMDECPVRTGALRDSTRREVDPSDPAAYVGSDLDYSVYVELGTRKMPPNGYMRRALASLRGILSGVWA